MPPRSAASRRSPRALDRELSALKAVAEACAGADDEDQLLRRVTDIICGAIQIDNFGITLYDPATGLLHDHPSSRRGRQYDPLPLGMGITGTVARTGKPMRVADVRREPVYIAGDPDVRSELTVPLVVRNQIIGAINTESTELDAFSAEDERLLVILAGQLAPALARLRSLKASQEREDQYRALFDGVPVGLYRTTREGGILDANRAILEMIGVSDLASLRNWNVRDGYADPGEREAWCRELEAQGQIHREIQWRRPDGSVLWVDERARVCRDPSGRVHYDGSVLDITERKRAEAEREGFRERLRQSEKLEAIGHLAGGVAHDFNNQLTAIMGFAESLEDLCQEEAQRLFARNILRSCQRSADLTRQLLAFARKGSIRAEPVDLHQLIGEVVNLLGHSIDKRIEIRASLAADRRVVLGDASQLQNALMNLGINARDAMPGGGLLVFETRSLDQGPAEAGPGPFLEITVADTGTGMDGETVRHIFEPFFTTKGLGEGTGLGLASVYGTVRQHEGHIQVQSAAGLGTRFAIYLPLRDLPVEEPACAPAPEPRRDRGHILFVDDETLVVEVTSQILEALDYQVTVRRDGAEAVEFYRKAWPDVDLVILDMVMPRMGGKDAFLAMRKINPQVKALIVSGFSVEGEAQHLLDSGALGFLQKPYRRIELARMVAKALKGG